MRQASDGQTSRSRLGYRSRVPKLMPHVGQSVFEAAVNQPQDLGAFSERNLGYLRATSLVISRPGDVCLRAQSSAPSLTTCAPRNWKPDRGEEANRLAEALASSRTLQLPATAQVAPGILRSPIRRSG
jgi:hypothetical protein